MAHQRPTAPVLSDMAKHAMLDLVPLAGPRRKVADLQGQAQCIRQVLQGNFPQPVAASIAAAAVGRNQQLTCLSMMLHTHLAPPAPNGLCRKARRIVINADTHPALVFGQIVHAIGNGLAPIFVNEIVDQDFYRLTLRLPLTTANAEFTDQFLLLGVHRNGRLASFLKVLDGRRDVLKLLIAIRMIRTFFRFAIALQAVARSGQQPPHRARTDRMSLRGQFARQMRGALTGPAQGRRWVTTRRWLYQSFQSTRQVGVKFGLRLAPTAFSTYLLREGPARIGLTLGQLAQATADRRGRHS